MNLAGALLFLLFPFSPGTLVRFVELRNVDAGEKYRDIEFSFISYFDKIRVKYMLGIVNT